MKDTSFCSYRKTRAVNAVLLCYIHVTALLVECVFISAKNTTILKQSRDKDLDIPSR